MRNRQSTILPALLCLLAFVLTLGLAGRAGAQSFTNPSFEAPTTSTYTTTAPTGWARTDNPSATAAAVDTDNAVAMTGTSAPDGSQVAELQFGAGLSQTVTGLTAGHSYSVTVAVNYRNGYSSGALSLLKDGAAQGSAYTPTGAANYQPYQDHAFSFTATSTSHVLALQVTGTITSSVIYIDNVRLTDLGAGALTGGTITAAATTSTAITPQEATISGGTGPYSTLFSYSATTNGTYTQIGTAVSGASPVANASATGLSPGTTYYFRAVTTDSAGTPATVTVPSTTTGTPLTTAAGGVTLAYSDSSNRYSPYNWDTGNSAAAAAISVNPGAYDKFGFTLPTGGGSVSLLFDTTALSGASVPTGAYPKIRYAVDGAAPVDYVLPAGGLVPLGSLAAGAHNCEFWYLGRQGGPNATAYDCWTAQSGYGNAPTYCLRYQGVSGPSGMTASNGWTLAPNTVLAFSDSQLEGMRVNDITDTTSGGDATATWVWGVGLAFNAEVGVVGFGSQSWSIGGTGNVPAFTGAWSLLYAGRSRSFAAAPTYCLIDEGTNGGPSSGVIQSWLGSARTAFGSGTKIFPLIPFRGQAASVITSDVSAYRTANPADAGVYSMPDASGQIASLWNYPLYSLDGIHETAKLHGMLGGLRVKQMQAAIGSATTTKLFRHIN